MFPTLEKYGLLTEFPRNLYKVYFYQRHNKMLTKLVELIRVSNLYKILEKSVTDLKWKMIEDAFKMRKNDSRFVEENGRILALGIFRLVLFPNLTRIICLEVVATFIVYKKTQINLITMILVKTILTLIHYRRFGKGKLIHYEQLLYIWLISHIETKKPVFNNFW
jgi:hypothetical protein